MSMRNYGIYQQGAIFFQEDFDPVKVILVLSEKFYKLTLPENIKTALLNNDFSVEVAAEICGMLNIDIENIEETLDYSGISNELITEAECEGWFYEFDAFIATEGVSIFIYTDIESEYIYDSDDVDDTSLENCYMFALDIPLAWNINNYKGFRSRDEVLRHIREIAKALLKDDIDWDRRLGQLTGTVFE